MTEHDRPNIVPTDLQPTQPATLVRDFTPELIDVGTHHLCPGCGEPVAMRAALEAIAELGVVRRESRRMATLRLSAVNGSLSAGASLSALSIDYRAPDTGPESTRFYSGRVDLGWQSELFSDHRVRASLSAGPEGSSSSVHGHPPILA